MTGQRGAPWWASGRTPDEGIAEGEDPVAAHRERRRAAEEPSDATSEPPDDAGVAWADAAEAMLGAMRSFGRAAAAARTDDVADRDGHRHTYDSEQCEVCPVCQALSALQRSRPEVADHLSEALRHLTLAATSILTPGGPSETSASGGLQRIDLDDDE